MRIIILSAGGITAYAAMLRPEFSTLPELIGYLRSTLSNVGSFEALEGLQEAVGADVNIRYEIVDSADKPSTGECPPEPTKGSKSKFAHVKGKTVSRILLTSKRNRTDMSTELFRQLNGLVLQLPNWKILAVPAAMFNPQPKESDLIANMTDYNIFPVYDGTIVTLYWYEPVKNSGSWRLSSTNGFDVNDYRWMSKLTYYEAFTSVAAKYKTFSLSGLNKSCSYTIGFRHHDFHPLRADGEKLWAIQSCNLAIVNNLIITDKSTAQVLKGESVTPNVNSNPILVIDTCEDIGIPMQRPITFMDANNQPELSPANIMKMMHTKNENALEAFSQGKTGDFVTQPHYGFFLRPKTHHLPDVMLESKLLNLLRMTLYNFPKKKAIGDVDLNADNRLDYAILRAYLGIHQRYPFITLFPQYEKTYKRYDELFNNIANRVAQIINKRAEKKHSDPIVEVLATHFADYIKGTKCDVSNNEGVNIILDFLRDRRYLDLYFNAVCSKK